MNWKKLLESSAESVNDEIRLRNDYLAAENRILRNQINGRVQLTHNERKELAEIGAKLGQQVLEDIATIAKPDTIVAWNRQFTTPHIDVPERPKAVGRPRVDQVIEDLVLRMARENRSWGYDRIQGALKHLGYTISDQTVGNILKRHGMAPAPERKKTVPWHEFIRCHLDVLRATDFFDGNVWSWFGYLISCLFGFIDVGCYQVRTLGTVLHQQMKAIHASVSYVLKTSAQFVKQLHCIRAITRFWAVHFGNALPCNPMFALPTNQEPGSSSQYTCKVLDISAARPRPIRDGPFHRHPQLDQGIGSPRREAA